MTDAGDDTDLLDGLRLLALDAALAAGDLLLDDRPVSLGVDTKSSPTDVVTEMDRRSERLLTERLLGARPGDGILGEEGSSVAGTSGIRWVVDPLDGTVNYLYSLPLWSVCIAAEDEASGRALVGVVRLPRLGETYVAVSGRGAVRHDRDGEHRLSVSGCATLDAALVATGFGYRAERRRAQARVVADLLPRVRDVRRGGAASVDLCWLASGRVDGYYERGLQPWDHAAAGLVAAEAGAVVSGLAGRPAGEDLLVAAGPALFPALHDALLALGADRD